MIRTLVSRLAARIGNWNDRHFAADTRAESPAFYRSLDRLVSRLYVQGDRELDSDFVKDGRKYQGFRVTPVPKKNREPQ